MGLFYIDTHEDSIEYKRKHKEEIKELAKECIEIGSASTNEIFPDFLWEPNLNEYEGDDYKLRGTCSNPNVLKAYTIRRKYSQYWDYIDALEAYLDYVDYVESAYGSFQMLKDAADNGVGLIYIPKKPKLTNKKSNKDLLRSGFVPSRIEEDFVENEELINADIVGIDKEETIYGDDEFYRLPKRVEKLHDREIASKVKSDRINSIYTSTSSGKYVQGIDAIINFLNNPNSGDIEEKNVKDSVSARIEDIHEYDYVPKEIIDDLFQPVTSYISSSFVVDPEKQRQKKILEALTEGGYNFLEKGATEGIDKSVVRAVTKKYRSTVDYSNLSPKEIKKLKKKEAKKKKKASERLIGDRRLQSALLRNKAHLSGADLSRVTLSDMVPFDED